MSTLVHRVLGYGLTNCPIIGKNRDPRLNPDGVLGSGDDDWFTTEKYIEFLEHRKVDADPGVFDPVSHIVKLDLAWGRDEQGNWIHKHSPSDCIKSNHYTDSEPDNILVLVDYTEYKHHYRMDDIIDYYLENDYHNHGREALESWIVWLDSPPYPYNGSFLDRRDGRRLDGGMGCAYCRLRNAIKDLPRRSKTRAAKIAEIENSQDALAPLLGFENHQEADEFMIPDVAPGIRLLVEFLQIFKDPNTIYELRPMVYTYWC